MTVILQLSLLFLNGFRAADQSPVFAPPHFCAGQSSFFVPPRFFYLFVLSQHQHIVGLKVHQ